MKNFDDDDAPSPDLKERGPEFQLGGQLFRCLPIVPGGLVGDILLTFVNTDDGPQRDVPRCITVIESLLVERLWNEDSGEWEATDDLKRWQELLHSKTVVIETRKIASVYDWLLGEYAARSSRPT